MADGTYERRGPREAELARLKRLLAEQQAKRRVDSVQTRKEKKAMTTKFVGVVLFMMAVAPSVRGEECAIAKFDPRMALESAVVADGVKWIDGQHLPLEGRAFSDVEHYYDRLPAKLSPNINGGVHSMKHHTAGMQFRFVTDSRKLTFKWIPFNNNLAMDHMPSTGVSGIDIYRRDAGGAWRYVKTGRITHAAGSSVSVDWTPGDECLVNLPLYNGIKSFTLGIDPAATVSLPSKRRSGIEKPVVFYGTSITHGGCCSRPGLSFVNIVGRKLDVPVVNLGFSGSGKCEIELADVIARIDASVFVIDTVWNMGSGLITARYEKFVRRLRELRPDTPIVLAEGCDVYQSNGGGWVQDGNKAMRPIYERFRNEGWKKLFFLPEKVQYSDDLEGTVDGCHPNDWGMMHMADAFADILRQALFAPGEAAL